MKKAFDTIRTKLGNDPEVLLYNCSGFVYSNFTFFVFFFEILFSIIVESILDLEPEALQAALNTTVVGGLVASQQVSKNKKQLHIILFYIS